MVISTSENSIVVAGTGSVFTFDYPFVADSVPVISVTYLDALGNQTVLNPSQYTLTINAPSPNQIWGIGGTVTYPLTGSAIAAGTYLLIERILPLTQETSVQNQGNYYATVTERALDIEEMQIQQISAATQLAIQIPAVDGTQLNTILPAAMLRANKFVAFDSSGNVITATGSSPGTVVISAAMIPVVQATTLILARAAMSVPSSIQMNDYGGGTSTTLMLPPGTTELFIYLCGPGGGAGGGSSSGGGGGGGAGGHNLLVASGSALGGMVLSIFTGTGGVGGTGAAGGGNAGNTGFASSVTFPNGFSFISGAGGGGIGSTGSPPAGFNSQQGGPNGGAAITGTPTPGLIFGQFNFSGSLGQSSNGLIGGWGGDNGTIGGGGKGGDGGGSPTAGADGLGGYAHIEYR